MLTGPLDVVALKSYGDLIIALTCADALDLGELNDVRVLLGSHLVPLYEATWSRVPAVVLDHSEAGVPSFYDIRKNGWRAAVRSGLELRRSLGASTSGTLLFDRIGWRERLLAGRHPAAQLPPRDNIYLAYREFFGPPASPAAPAAFKDGLIGIFPGSRLAAKNMPLELVSAVQRTIAAAGGNAALLLLEGERLDLERAQLGATIVPRDFEAMIHAVRGCAVIVSADSMPAHIAEMLGKPVFVFTPVVNSYWLPYSAFTAGSWGLFADGPEGRFGDFLNGIGK